MSNNSFTRLNGVTDAVFGHRLVLITEDRRTRLADLGPRDGEHVECHVERDGSIREVKAVESDDDKWAAEMKPAA